MVISFNGCNGQTPPRVVQFLFSLSGVITLMAPLFMEAGMMISKICSHCGKSLKVGETCSCRIREKGRRYDELSRDEEKRAFYHSNAWVKVREQVLKRDAYIDMYAYRNGRIIPATIVHHIEPFEDNPSAALNTSNLLSVSAGSHAEIHRRYAEGEKEECMKELREMVHG
jgi:hypothetical protein